jgi:predicted DNA-binding antitoxin AbrB/MazE fold protein
MTRHIDAVYENGMLRPLEPLPFGELERVRVTVTDETEWTGREFFEQLARELAASGPVPTLAEVREMLAHDKSSWSDAIVAERREH